MNIEYDGTDMYIVREDVRIAKRGPQDGTWVILEPGYSVTDASNGAVVVQHKGGAEYYVRQ
jgi:hypothetical protein